MSHPDIIHHALIAHQKELERKLKAYEQKAAAGLARNSTGPATSSGATGP